ncbi:MAG TPA: DUF222 domain-containing protein [Mycobacteriales bacterium]|nr:DUF222 domain-containing protein [Mycobacteriales bacterium]
MGNLGSVLDEMLALDPFDLPGPALGAEICEQRRAANRLDGAYLTMLAAYDSTGASTAEYGSTQAWARATLRMSPSRASRDVHLARDLRCLPLTRAALEAGEISLDHALVIAGLRGLIPDEVMADVEGHLVDAAGWKNPVELRRVTAHVVHSYARDRTARDERDDYQARALFSSVTIGGMGVGNFTLHPAGMETVQTALHALSKPIAGDDRSPAQRRADALVTMAELAMRSGDLPDTGGVKPHVSVVVTLGSIIGESGAPGADYGFGATTSAEWARRYACDASVSRVVFGPDGGVLDAGRSARTFNAAQTRAIVARDRGCIWDSCDAPASWCEAHHCIHWAHGGESNVDNGALLCARHHDRVHVDGHRIIKTTHGPYRIDRNPRSDPNWHGHPHPPRRQ